MDYMGGLSSIVSIVSFVVFVAGVMKVFQMATTLNEIKDVLTSIQHNASMNHPAGSPIAPPASVPIVQSGEEMLRALSMELDHPVPAVNPTSIELGNKS